MQLGNPKTDLTHIVPKQILTKKSQLSNDRENGRDDSNGHTDHESIDRKSVGRLEKGINAWGGLTPRAEGPTLKGRKYTNTG